MFEDQDNDTKLGKSEQEETNEETQIHTIPDEFHGGNNPNVYEEKQQAKQRVQEKLDKNNSNEDESHNYQKNKQASLRKKILIGGGIFLLLLLVGGGSAFMFYSPNSSLVGLVGLFDAQDKKDKTKKKSTKKRQRQDSESEDEDKSKTKKDAGVKQISNTSTTQTSSKKTETSSQSSVDDTRVTAQPLEFPDILSSDSIDLDSDDLTDKEEELLDTDSGRWDSDGDGYYDGQELRNLYNPNKKAPAELIKADTVVDYKNPRWGYEVYYPKKWKQSAVTDDYSQILFSSITGDYIEIRKEDKKPTESFNDWFARRVEGEKRGDLQQFSNELEVKGYRRSDNLVVYFPFEDQVYLLIYNPGTTENILFREIMIMMYQSFNPTGDNTDLESQNIIPSTPTTTEQDQTSTLPQTTTSTVSTSTTSTPDVTPNQ